MHTSMGSATDGRGLRAERLLVRRGGRVVLDGVDLEALPGEVTAIAGPSGAGKSTLLTALAGIRRPDGGSAGRAGRDPVGYLRGYPSSV